MYERQDDALYTVQGQMFPHGFWTSLLQIDVIFLLCNNEPHPCERGAAGATRAATRALDKPAARNKLTLHRQVRFHELHKRVFWLQTGQLGGSRSKEIQDRKQLRQENRPQPQPMHLLPAQGGIQALCYLHKANMP